MIRKSLPIFLILLGAAALAVAFGADLLGLGGDPGMGTRQIILALVAALMLAMGVAVRYNLDWGRIFAGPSVSPVQVLQMAISLGLLAGLLEDLVFFARKWIFHIIFTLNPHIFWMKPLANLILFTLFGLILLLLAKGWPKVFSLRVITFVLVFFTCLTPLLAFPQLHVWARILLAAGLAVQIARLAASHSERFHAMVRRTVFWSVTLTAMIGLGVYTWKAVPEYRALAKLPTADAGAPNVLLIVMDTVRSQSLSLYGYDRPTTPRLEAFARTGVCFEQALATSSWTLSSHATMFTGRFSHELFADWQTPLDARTAMPDTYPTLAEILSDRGFVTAGFVGNVGYCSYEFDLDRGFVHYEDYVPSLELFFSCSSLTGRIARQYRNMTGNHQLVGRKSATDVNEAFLEWLSHNDKRPFFAFLNYFDAHDPYLAPETFDLKFGSKKPDIPSLRHEHKYTAPEIQALQDAYDSCIAYLDHEIGSLLDGLQDRGVLENTLVIITSDHGEQFGEHGLMYHVNSLYRQLLQVPLLICLPKVVPAGRRVREPVSLRDLPSTVVDLLGLGDDVRFPGSSLARHWESAKAPTNGRLRMQLSEVQIGDEKPDWFPEFWPVAKGSMKSLVRDGYHYIRYGDGSEELFDFEKDPGENHNLTDSADDHPKLRQMRSAVEAVLNSSLTVKELNN